MPVGWLRSIEAAASCCMRGAFCRIEKLTFNNVTKVKRDEGVCTLRG